MAWNGSGTFSRITTTVSPAVGGTTIDVADQNTYTADVTAGISACLAKNGENAATGNLDMGGFRHTDVADAVAATDYAALGQVETLIAAEIEDIGFSVYDTVSAPSTNTWTQIAWTTETRDPGNNFASNAYTCPTDGVYQFNAGLTYASMAATSGPHEIAIYLNGSVYRVSGNVWNSTVGVASLGLQISISDAFSASDVITVWTRHQGAATEDFQVADAYNFFNGHRVVRTG